MRDSCLREETLQSYFDGELAAAKLQDAAAHLARCAACAQRAREIESEIAMVSDLFARQTPLNVPTESLRARLDASIRELQSSPSLASAGTERAQLPVKTWRAVLAGLFAIPQRRPAVFASLVAFVALAVIFAATFLQQTGPKVAQTNTARADAAPPRDLVAQETLNNNRTIAVASPPSPFSVNSDDVQPTKARYAARGKRTSGRRMVLENANGLRLAALALPGEQGYLRAISSLTTVIEAGGERAMRPALRAEYERNLAVVDQAIAATRAEASRKPNDPVAADFVLSAYQSKIDLLNAVASETRTSNGDR